MPSKTPKARNASSAKGARKANAALQKPLQPSKELAAVVGSDPLSRGQMVSVRCRAQGHMVPATIVDHVVPHRGDPKLFWAEANWAALCKRCHDSKTAREGRWGVA